MKKVLAVPALVVASAATVAGPTPDRPARFLDSGSVLPVGLPFSKAVRVGNTLHLSG